MSKVKIRGDRNVPWIGDLAFRDVIPLKYVSKINTATLPENTSPETILDYIDISAVDSDGHIGDIQELTFETAPSRARRVVRKGDTIVSTVRTYLKAIAHIDWDNPRLVCSTGFAVVSPSEGMDPKYMYYWLRSTPIVDEISARSVGVSYPAIGPSEVGSLPVPRIPERLQRDIVAFLDGRIRAIDKILGRYQLLIERLHEYRQALITQAVTKGLDPNVPMKESGISWAGTIPEYWQTIRLKHIAKLRSGESITAEEIDTVGLYPVYGGNGIRGYTDRYTHEGTHILIGRQGALCGNVHYAHGRFWASEHAVVVTPLRPLSTVWLGELLRAMNLNQYSIAAAQPGLAVGVIGSLKIPVPPLEEQKKIAAYLREINERLDQVVIRVNRLIEHVLEYRQALITAAVTGKIDVRQEVQEHAG